MVSGKAASVKKPERIIVGISGASGIIYGIRILELLRSTRLEAHLVISQAAEMTLAYETGLKTAAVKKLADVNYPVRDIGAAIASGSYATIGMVIAPCSIRTLSEIATGVTSSLLTRAGDVVLKEKRRLVLMVRESPLHSGHLRNMAALSDMGAVIAPPVPAFYTRPETVDDIVTQTAARMLAHFGIEVEALRHWDEFRK